MIWGSIDAFTRRLQKHGFIKIGSGMYGTVYAKPGSDKVIKVGDIFDAWPAYIAWAKQNKHLGTFAPNVTAFRIIHPRDNYPFYVAVMDRLYRVSGSPPSEHPARPLLDDIISATLPRVLPPEHPWASFFDTLNQYRMEQDFYWDLHYGNFMADATGRLVLIDPFTFRMGNNSGQSTINTAKLFDRRNPQLAQAA